MTDSKPPESSEEILAELLQLVGPHPVVGQLSEYAEKIKSFPTMAEDDEKQCLIQIKDSPDSSLAAKRRLLQSNLGLVIKLARRNHGRGAALLDLIEEGNTALILAIANFDYESEQNFKLYLTWSIRKAIADKIDGRALLTEPESAELQAARNAEECAYMLECKAEMEQEDIEKKERSREISRQDLLREDLTELMKALSDHEKELVNLRFGLPEGKQHSLAEIAVMYNTTPHLVRELERSAMRKLKRLKNRN